MIKEPKEQQLFKNICAVILAAGRGSRMKSNVPKIIHKVNGIPLILFPLNTLKVMNLSQIITVIKHQADLVLPVIASHSEVAYQGEKYGTAKAVESIFPLLHDNINTIMVMNGDDSMFYSVKTLKSILKQHKKQKNSITFITLNKENPEGYGRVIYDKIGNFCKIVEEKDATLNEKKITEVNDGVYIFDRIFLEKFIRTIKPSSITGEYYLTDLINIALKNNLRVGTYLLKNSLEFYSISTKEDIKKVLQPDSPSFYLTTIQDVQEYGLRGDRMDKVEVKN